jgi:hypothetical protein
MRKEAARYASQPTIDTGQAQGMPPLFGQGGMNRYAALFPMGTNSSLANAARQSGMNQNPAAHPSPMQPTLATEQGVQQALAKVSEAYGARADDPETFVEVLSRFAKRADVSTGGSAAPGKQSLGPQSGLGSAPAPQGVRSQNAPVTQPGTTSGLGAQQRNLHGVTVPTAAQSLNPLAQMNPLAQLARSGWRGLTPGTSSPLGTLQKSAQGPMMVPGPANMPPVPGLTANQPPPPGPAGAGAPPPGAPPGGAPAQPPPGPGGMPAPVAPMAEPPPQPLPANPRPQPPQPQPKSSAQAQQEANLLRLLESKQHAEMGQPNGGVGGAPGGGLSDMAAQGMAMGVKQSHTRLWDSLPGLATKFAAVPGGLFEPGGLPLFRKALEYGRRNPRTGQDPNADPGEAQGIKKAGILSGLGNALGGVGRGIGRLFGGAGGAAARMIPEEVMQAARAGPRTLHVRIPRIASGDLQDVSGLVRDMALNQGNSPSEAIRFARMAARRVAGMRPSQQALLPGEADIGRMAHNLPGAMPTAEAANLPVARALTPPGAGGNFPMAREMRLPTAYPVAEPWMPQALGSVARQSPTFAAQAGGMAQRAARRAPRLGGAATPPPVAQVIGETPPWFAPRGQAQPQARTTGMGPGRAPPALPEFGDMVRAAADEGVEDMPVGNPHMRGWQWKVLRKDEEEGKSRWMPRLFQSPATPLTELLASPAKQGILQGLVGGGLGAGLGYLAGQHLDTGMPTHQLAAIGGGAGGLLGMLRGYGHRREKNDEIVDALRRSPPGATVRDYEAVQRMDDKVGFDVSNGTRTIDHRVLAREYAERFRAAVHADAATGVFGKRAAQAPDGRLSPARSATGESTGLSFAHKDDDYAQGQAAWAATSKYFKGGSRVKKEPSPFEGRHRGAEKHAGLGSALGNLGKRLMGGFRGFMANPAAQAAERGAARALPAAEHTLPQTLPQAASRFPVARPFAPPPGAPVPHAPAAPGRIPFEDWHTQNLTMPGHLRDYHDVAQTIGDQRIRRLMLENPGQFGGMQGQRRDYNEWMRNARSQYDEAMRKFGADLTPFAQGFFAHCDADGMTESEVRAAVTKVGSDYGDVARQELEDGLVKRAAPNWGQVAQAGRNTLNRVGGWFGRGGGAQAVQAVEHAAPRMPSSMAGRLAPGVEALGAQMPHMPPHVAPHLPGEAFGRAGPSSLAYRASPEAIAGQHIPFASPADAMAMRQRVPSMAARVTPDMWRNAPGAASQAAHAAPTSGWDFARRQLVGSGAGAAAGAWAGDDIAAPSFGMDPHLAGALYGAAAFNPYLARMGLRSRGVGALANPVMRGVQGSTAGAFGGSVLDMLAGFGGVPDTHFGHIGGQVGGAAGLASGTGRAMNRLGAPGGRIATQGRNLTNFAEGALGPVMNPINTAYRAFGNQAPQWLRSGFTPARFGANTAAMRGGRQLGMWGGGLLGARELMGGVKRDLSNTVTNTANQYLQSAIPQIADYGEDRTMGMLDRLGVLNQQGQFSPMQGIGRGLSQGVQGLMRHAHPLFRALGLNPQNMSPMQQAAILGGGGLGGAGLMTGHPMLAGAGGLTSLAGLLPGLMGRGEGQPPPDWANAGTAAAPPTTPVARDEYAHQTGRQPQF